MKLFVYPYKSDSDSAKMLAKSLGCKRIKRKDSAFVGSKDKIIVNWGNTALRGEAYNCGRILNPTEKVRLSVDKVKFFNYINDNSDLNLTPDFTEGKDIATKWLLEGHSVVCRTTEKGHDGEGIIIVDPPEVELPDAPLYTKLFNKTHEFRIHMFKDSEGNFFDFEPRLKLLKNGQIEDIRVRTTSNGCFFKRQNINIPREVFNVAGFVMATIGLDFAGIDIGYDERTNTAVCFEVNTAFELTQTISDALAQCIKETYVE